jgi:hypothetical protein
VENDDDEFDPATVTKEDIKSSYRKLAMKVHPDQGGNTNAFSMVSNANEILGDEEKRKQYDLTGTEMNSEYGFTEFFEEFVKKNFTFKVTKEYGETIHNIIYMFLVVLTIIQLSAKFFYGTAKGMIYSEEKYKCGISGIVLAWIMFYFSRSWIYSGCLFCFHFSFLSGFLLGSFGFYLRHFVAIFFAMFSLAAIGTALPLKTTFYICTFGSFVGRFLYGYGWIYSFFLTFFLLTIRFAIVMAIGLLFIILIMLVKNEKIAFGLTISFSIFFYYLEFSWTFLLISFGLGIYFSIQMYRINNGLISEEEADESEGE